MVGRPSGDGRTLRFVVVTTDDVARFKYGVTAGTCFLALRSNWRTKLENGSEEEKEKTFTTSPESRPPKRKHCVPTRQETARDCFRRLLPCFVGSQRKIYGHCFLPTGVGGVFLWWERAIQNEAWGVNHFARDSGVLLPVDVPASKGRKKKIPVHIYWLRWSKGNCWPHFCSRRSLCDDVLFSLCFSSSEMSFVLPQLWIAKACIVCT